ncbi:MAG: phage holin family protein [Bacteroidota bacterium]|nr:phage holin family protein [Bacteroidota bacterium]
MGNSSMGINNLADNIKEYIETRIEIIKLETADSGASAVSSLMSWAIIVIVGFLFLFTLSIGSAIGIGYLTENFALGFFIVTGVYLLIGLVLYVNRSNWLRKPLINTIIKNIYDDE